MEIQGNVGRSLSDVTRPGSQVEQPGSQLGQDDFLMLMVEQMRNQNPLEPQDSTDFIAQIAQFDTLTAMREIVQAVKSLASVGELANASALVGRTVTAEIDGGADPVTGLPLPPEQVTGVVDRVTFDLSGAVVHIGNRAIPAGLIVEVGSASPAIEAPADTETEAGTATETDSATSTTTETDGEAGPGTEAVIDTGSATETEPAAVEPTETEPVETATEAATTAGGS